MPGTANATIGNAALPIYTDKVNRAKCRCNRARNHNTYRMIVASKGIRPTISLNCMAIIAFKIVWVPGAKPIKLDRHPLIIYFLNPNTAHGYRQWADS